MAEKNAPRPFLKTGMTIQNPASTTVDIYVGDIDSPLTENLKGKSTDKAVILPQIKINKLVNK